MVDIIGFLSFFGIVAVAYLGLFLGRLILFIAPEENLPEKSAKILYISIVLLLLSVNDRQNCGG